MLLPLIHPLQATTTASVKHLENSCQRSVLFLLLFAQKRKTSLAMATLGVTHHYAGVSGIGLQGRPPRVTIHPLLSRLVMAADT